MDNEIPIKVGHSVLGFGNLIGSSTYGMVMYKGSRRLFKWKAFQKRAPTYASPLPPTTTMVGAKCMACWLLSCSSEQLHIESTLDHVLCFRSDFAYLNFSVTFIEVSTIAAFL